jgi:hypothetical protein
VIKVRKRTLGEEHPNTLSVMANLAISYSNQGQTHEATELEMKVIEVRKRTLGEEHLNTLSVMANLAISYSNQG